MRGATVANDAPPCVGSILSAIKFSARYRVDPDFTQKGRSNRAIFYAMQAEVNEALDEGWTVIQIYRVLQAEGRVKFSYQSFRLYVNRLILNPGQTRKTSKGDKPATPQAEKSEPAAKQQEDTVKGFVWNPHPNKDDLV